MANYIVSDGNLSAVADAIRARGGTSEPLAFPAGFVSALEAIPDTGDSFIMRAISGSYENSRVTKVGDYAFTNCVSLNMANFPACTSIGAYAFAGCLRLMSISFPVCKAIGNYAFSMASILTNVDFPSCYMIYSNAFNLCARLFSVSFPACKTIGSSAFVACVTLQTVSFPVCTTISNSAFLNCVRLTSFYLMGSSVCALKHSGAFASTPIGGYSDVAGQYGSIYVPASLLSNYQTASNWSYYSSRFVGLTDEEIEALEG